MFKNALYALSLLKGSMDINHTCTDISLEDEKND